MIIALAGRSRVGKDTVAEVLVNKFGFTRFAFGDQLKECCADAFDIPRRYFEDQEKDRHLPSPFIFTEQVSRSFIDRIASESGNNNIPTEILHSIREKVADKVAETPRKILQIAGSEIGRTIDPDIWINIVLNKIKNCENPNIVITDARMPNERKVLKELGAKVGLVLRPNIDLLYPDSYSSENSLGEQNEYDFIFRNDGSRSVLQEEVEFWFRTVYYK